jgi:polar amino acid transport system substrate-binding protein
MAWSLLVVAVAAAAVVLIFRNTSDHLGIGSDLPLRAGYALEAPYAFRDADGTLRGEAVDTLRAALQRAGLPEPVWVHVEFPRLLHELRSGRIDVIAAGMFITPERAAQAAFTRPTTSVRMGLLVSDGNPLGLHALADLRRAGSAAKLAVLEGSVELERAREADLPEGQLLRLPDAGSALAAVRSGQAAAFALSAPSLRWAMRESPGLALAAPFTVPQHGGHPDIGFPAFVFRPGDPRRDRLDHALSGYLGSADHLRAVGPHGFGADDIAAAHGLDPGQLRKGEVR